MLTFLNDIWCGLVHSGGYYTVIRWYSNRTCRWRCRACGREWDGD